MSSLVKLKLYAYSDSAFSSEVGNYEVAINPESYTHNHSVKFSDSKSLAEGAGNAPKFNSIGTETVDFTVYMDGTGIAGNTTSVEDQISSLKEIAYDYNGDSHRTNYVKLSWGSLVFYCNLTKMNINYTMFSASGDPLRAKVDVGFSGFTDSKLMAATANKSSPDMSHLKTMTVSDSIPLYCAEIYKNSDLYIEVARANDLDSFRNVPIGKSIMFPQLNK